MKTSACVIYIECEIYIYIIYSSVKTVFIRIKTFVASVFNFIYFIARQFQQQILKLFNKEHL